MGAVATAFPKLAKQKTAWQATPPDLLYPNLTLHSGDCNPAKYKNTLQIPTGRDIFGIVAVCAENVMPPRQVQRLVILRFTVWLRDRAQG
jgi:hypothetical protein